VLWFNLLACSIPAIAIAFNPVSDDSMKEGSYKLGSIFDGGLKSEIFIRGLLTTILALIAFVFSQERATTATITVLIFSQIAFSFQCRRTPDESFIRKYITNRVLLAFAPLVILLHMLIVYIPQLNKIFNTSPLLFTDWIPIAIAFFISSLPLDELFAANVEDRTVNEVEEMEAGSGNILSEEERAIESD
jgi:Ca2+-transporting ATPase